MGWGRFMHSREFYKPRNSARVTFKTVPGAEVFWAKTARGRFHAVGFKGRAQKPLFNHTFASYERMTRYVTEVYEGLAARSETKRRERDVLKTITPVIKVGDIFSSSWGYEQTNVYFYQVVGLKGKSTALLRRIAGERHYDGPMSGSTVPARDAFIGEEVQQKRIQVTDKTGRPHFKMASYEYAYPHRDGEARRFSEWH